MKFIHFKNHFTLTAFTYFCPINCSLKYKYHCQWWVANCDLLVANIGPLRGRLACFPLHENYAEGSIKKFQISLCYQLLLSSSFLCLLSLILCCICEQPECYTETLKDCVWCNRRQSQTRPLLFDRNILFPLCLGESHS